MEGNGSKKTMGLDVPNFLCKNKNCRYEKLIPSARELEHFLKKLISCPVCRATENYNKTLALDSSIIFVCRRCGTSFQFTPNHATEHASEIPNHKSDGYSKGEQPSLKLSNDSFKQPRKVDETRLQKAVETALSAGYQLSKDAFDFLSQTAATRDPVARVGDAIRRLGDLQTKPFFIERDHLDL
jgi:transcription elongation factor Elf1